MRPPSRLSILACHPLLSGLVLLTLDAGARGAFFSASLYAGCEAQAKLGPCLLAGPVGVLLGSSPALAEGGSRTTGYGRGSET